MADRLPANRLWYMLGLIVAGEAIFVLPFNLARFFRPTVLDVLGLTNTQLGAAQGLYGLVAIGAYFVGGPIADRFEARKLLAWSLWSTALGGLYLASFPGLRGTYALWAFFALTTILLFWAALIKATRVWGGAHEQGRAYGILDGGRGLVAAILASAGVALLELSFPNGAATASHEAKAQVLRWIIYGYSTVTALCGGLVWFALNTTGESEIAARRHSSLADLRAALAYRSVWLQALIVLAAYVGYKGFDNYSLFAVEAHGLDEIEAARIVTIGAWVRPFAALGAGLLADRLAASKLSVIAFGSLLVSQLYFALAAPTPGWGFALLANTVVACAALFGLRGVYFALFEEAKVPLAVTGSAVGLVSLVGYTPDVFVNYVAGRLNDASPGLPGHQHFFFFLAFFSALGLVASLAFARLRFADTEHSAKLVSPA